MPYSYCLYTLYQFYERGLTMSFYGPIYRSTRGILRLILKRDQICYQSSNQAHPAVYIAHHRNMYGPIHTLISMSGNIRFWGLSVFYSRSECFHQYYDYTFTKRMGMPRLFAAPAAGLAALFIPALMKSGRSIPVYRSSRQITKTMKKSLAALKHGDDLLIFPDLNYDSSDHNMGNIYSGFLHLERMYHKETGQHLAFVPVSCNKEQRCITVGEAIYFNDESSFREQKDLIAARLVQTINDMNNESLS